MTAAEAALPWRCPWSAAGYWRRVWPAAACGTRWRWSAQAVLLLLLLAAIFAPLVAPADPLRPA
jgi:hypothetical protein